MKGLTKKSGQIEIVTGMFLILLLVILLATHIQIMTFYSTSLYMEDALAASNLASAVIDVEEYGISHVIQITSPDLAYELYEEAIRINLQLDDQWNSSNQSLISGKVDILQYIIYNVNEEDITVHYFEPGRYYSYMEPGGTNRIRTPDGAVVESTTIYSKIGFPVEGVLGISVYAEKEQSVDIVSNLEYGKDGEE